MKSIKFCVNISQQFSVFQIYNRFTCQPLTVIVSSKQILPLFFLEKMRKLHRLNVKVFIQHLTSIGYEEALISKLFQNDYYNVLPSTLWNHNIYIHNFVWSWKAYHLRRQKSLNKISMILWRICLSVWFISGFKILIVVIVADVIWMFWTPWCGQ